MNSRRRRGLVLASMLAGLLVAGAAAALSLSGPVLLATTTPPWEPGCDIAIGHITFYDANGAQMTSGRMDASPFAAYAVASKPGRQGANPDDRALLQMYTPVPGVNPGSWQTGDQLGGTTPYPPKSLPAKLANTTLPIASGASGDYSLQDFINYDFPNTQTDPAYRNLYQVRLETSSVVNGVDSTEYFRTDILADPAHGTWSVVYPAPGDPDPCAPSPSASASTSPSPTPTANGGGTPPTPTTPTTATSAPPVDRPTDQPVDEPTSASPTPSGTDEGGGVPVAADTPSSAPDSTPSPSPAPGASFVPMANPSGPIGGPLAQTGLPMNVVAVGGLVLLLCGTGVVAVLGRVLRDDSWPPYA